MFNEDTGPIYKGVSVLDQTGNDLVLAMLKEEGALFNSYKF